jgi:hypothetical protein
LIFHPEEMDAMKKEGRRLQKLSTLAGDTTLDSYDYSKLGGKNINPEEQWEIQMETMLYVVSKDGRKIDSESKEASTTPGALPAFQLYFFDSAMNARNVEEFVGLPDSVALLKQVPETFRF